MQNELTTQNSSLTSQSDFFNSIEEMTAFAGKMLNKGITPHKSTEAVVAAMLLGKELGLKGITAQSHIFYINDSPVTDIHIKNSLLLMAGVITKVVRNFAPLYIYADSGSKNEKGEYKITFKEELLPIEAIRLRETSPAEFNEKYIISAIPYDYVTSVYFQRKTKSPVDGSIQVIEHTENYYYSEAADADLLKKKNWINAKRRMMVVRAMDNGMDFIASDIIMGIRTKEVWEDTFNVNLDSKVNSTIDAESEVVEDKVQQVI